VTVHDLIHETLEEDKSLLDYRRAILVNSTAIVAVSENTKRELLNFYPQIKEKKIHVIHHGVCPKRTNRRIIKKNFLLYVGQREGYKNFDIVLLSLKELVKKRKIEFIVVGPKPNAAEISNIIELDLKQFVKFKNSVTDHELEILYSECLAFVYPSLHEGFGYPLIEAMASGAIPIGSITSCIPEILGSAGITTDLNSHINLTNSILKILNDQNLSEKLTLASIKRAKDFSISFFAKNYMALYRSLLIK
jgi:glycosyltransferase involved in cell wall biosynthesis